MKDLYDCMASDLIHPHAIPQASYQSHIGEGNVLVWRVSVCRNFLSYILL